MPPTQGEQAGHLALVSQVYSEHSVAGEHSLQSDRGDGPIGLIIGSGVFLAGFMMVIYLALGYHGQQVLAGATQEGAVFAARLDGDPRDGVALTNELISSSAGSLFVNLSVTGPTFETNSAGDEWVVIEASAEVKGPLGQWPVSARGSAPVEQFTPQPG